MHPAPTHRWGLGFIAMRWRHVFWLLPLVGLVISLGLQLWSLYGPTAVGTIQARPITGHYVAKFPVDVANILQSDTILSKTTDSLDLAERWASNSEMCVPELRKMIRSQPIPGTSLIEVRVVGRSRRESIEIWKALLAHTNQHFADLRSADDDAKRAVMESTIKALELDLDQKRRELSVALSQGMPMIGATDSADKEKRKADFAKLKSDFEAAQKALEAAKIHFISSQMGCILMENPIIPNEEPVIVSPWTHWEVLRPLLVQVGIGLSIGVLLTAPLAYLLELLLPRRRPEFQLET